MTTCQKCSEMRWHPYPEEKPEVYGLLYFVQLRSGARIQTVWSGSWSNVIAGDEDVTAWYDCEMPPPRTIPPKKKTVRVTREQFLEAERNFVYKKNQGYGMTKEADLPDFIEIEVSDE